MHRPFKVETEFLGGSGTAEVLGVSRDRAEQLIARVHDSAIALRRKANSKDKGKVAKSGGASKRSGGVRGSKQSASASGAKSASKKAGSKKNASTRANSIAKSTKRKTVLK